MIAAWMIYTVAITTLLFAGAAAAEHVARALGAPTRFVWSVAMVVALALSARTFVSAGHASSDSAASHRSTSTALAHRTLSLNIRPRSGSASVTTPLAAIQRLHIVAGAMSQAIGSLYLRIDVAALTRYDIALGLVWLAMSVAVLAYCVASLVGVRRIERTLRPGHLDQYPVLVSSDIGPALFGILRARVVVPRWVLSLAPREREMILVHERAHAAAYDPALLCIATLALVLQPWNVALWACFARVRLAIETDCDRRVLGALGGFNALGARENVREYGRLMVAVYQRSMAGHVPFIAFVQRPSHLERRIRHMTRVPRIISVGGGGAAFVAIALATTAWMTPAPPRVVANAGTAAPGSPHSVSKSTSCIIAGRLAGPSPANGPRPMSDGCTIDGDIMVMTLDSSRVLVAVHEGADDAPREADYLVFTIANDSAPIGLRWWAHDHAEFRDNVLYVASPSSNIPAMAFGGTRAASHSSYPKALPLVYDDMEILRHPSVTWNVLRQLPVAPRCAHGGPIIIVDGAVVEHGDCFVVDGQEFPIG